jgi:hypothetical protein
MSLILKRPVRQAARVARAVVRTQAVTRRVIANKIRFKKAPNAFLLLTRRFFAAVLAYG